jgi:hypothetical protein
MIDKVSEMFKEVSFLIKRECRKIDFGLQNEYEIGIL